MTKYPSELHTVFVRQKGFAFLPLLIIFTLIGVIGYLIYQNALLKRLGRNENFSINNPTNTPTISTSSPSPTADKFANWKTFKLKTLGIEFRIHPKLDKYGSLKETISSAEKGTYICITYPSKNSSLVNTVLAGGAGCNVLNFGMEANSIGFEAGRSGSYLDIQGFEFKNGVAYYNWMKGTDYEKQYEIPSDIVTIYSERILKIKGKDHTELTIWPSTGIIGAIVNTDSDTYPGLVISASLKDGLTEEEFDQILSTFKFTQ